MENRTYIAIDLKSFYASVECIERGLDPMTTNLVVADESRTAKTICLAVSPSLRARGVPGRARLFEVIQKVRQINEDRRRASPKGELTFKTYDDRVIKSDPSAAVDYLIAPPQMAHYMKRSAEIYNVYLKYISPEDIHVYSIDEVFIDATKYLRLHGISARELAMKMILDVLSQTGITATAGIGPNLYICKVAMDIGAKHIPPDKNGVRISELDERSYREKLWSHRPITDFWRVGRGYAKRLAENGMFTMGDVARCSAGKKGSYYSEDLLYKMFGVNAELLIDHAWGWEPCTIADIKSYKPETNSIGTGQVLQYPYDFNKARLVVREIADSLALELVEKELATDRLVLMIGYDVENLKDPKLRAKYSGEVTTDQYGRQIPKGARGTGNPGGYTSSAGIIRKTALELFDKITDEKLLIRRINLTLCHVKDEKSIPREPVYEQMDLFTNYKELQLREKDEKERLRREKQLQEAMLTIKKRFGKNAILKGTDLEDGATAADRNKLIGGHKA